MQKRQASSFYQHFDKEEKPTVDKLVGFFNQTIYRNEPVLTNFLNPRQRYILKIIVGSEINYQEFGGYENSEKKRVILDTNWEYHELTDFLIDPIEIDYNSKFSELTHSQILGVLANSGIKVETIGDIITDGLRHWQFFVTDEISKFLLTQVDRIGRTTVRLKKKKLNEVIQNHDDHVQSVVISTSLRLDSILSNFAHISRSQAKIAIHEQLVKLNWHQVTDSNIIVKVDDVISLQHFGRIKIIDINLTRKGKYRMEGYLWQSKSRM